MLSKRLRCLKGCSELRGLFFLSVFLLFTLIFMFFSSDALNAEAATKSKRFRYKNYTTLKTETYNGTVANYRIDGVKINMEEHRAMVFDDVAYAAANVIFRDYAGADCKYSIKKKCLTIKYNKHVLKLFPGERECILDGETITAPGTPFRIKYIKSGYIDTMVPTRFVSDCLGIDYEWDGNIETVIMNTPFAITINGVYRDYTGSKAKMTIDENQVKLTGTPSLILSDNCVFCARDEVFEAAGIDYSYNKKTGEIILSRKGKTIYGCVGSSITYIDGILTYAPYAFSNIVYEKNGKSYIYLPGRFVFENLGFDYEWIEAEKTSQITDISDNNDISTEYPGLIKVINPQNGYRYFLEKVDCGQYISLPVPEDVASEDIMVNDLFMDRRLQFVLDGNYSEFYSQMDFINTGDCILQCRIYYNSASDTTEINFYSSYILDYEILEGTDEGILELYIDYTKNINQKVIVLDAGHGGHDSGAESGGVHESDLNLKIVNYAADYLKNSKIKVYCTRTTDVFYSLGERAALSEIVGADMFIAVHHNASDNSSAKGSSIYYSLLDTTESLNGLTSEALADAFIKNMTDKLGTEDRGVIAENFVVVRDSKAPAVLLEVGFITCPAERKRLVKDSFSKKAARVIRDTVKQIYRDYK